MALQYISQCILKNSVRRKLKLLVRTLESTVRPTSVLSSAADFTITLAKTLYLKCMYGLASISFADNGSSSIITFFLAIISILDWFTNTVHHTTQQILALQNGSCNLEREITDHDLLQHVLLLKETCQMTPAVSDPNL